MQYYNIVFVESDKRQVLIEPAFLAGIESPRLATIEQRLSTQSRYTCIFELMVSMGLSQTLIARRAMAVAALIFDLLGKLSIQEVAGDGCRFSSQ